MLVDDRFGYLHVYSGRPGTKNGFTTLEVPFLKLTLDEPWGKFMIERLRDWFDFVWNDGAYPKNPELSAKLVPSALSR